MASKSSTHLVLVFDVTSIVVPQIDSNIGRPTLFRSLRNDESAIDDLIFG
jgi:hypothetical protein